jgi:hypothetical protein
MQLILLFWLLLFLLLWLLLPLICWLLLLLCLWLFFLFFLLISQLLSFCIVYTPFCCVWWHHTQPVLQGCQAEIPAKKLKRGHRKKNFWPNFG